jgi:hypothetical protein
MTNALAPCVRSMLYRILSVDLTSAAFVAGDVAEGGRHRPNHAVRGIVIGGDPEQEHFGDGVTESLTKNGGSESARCSLPRALVS